jgi:ribosome biogenesis GTPase
MGLFCLKNDVFSKSLKQKIKQKENTLRESIRKEYSKYQENMSLGKIVTVHKNIYEIVSNHKKYKGSVSGRFNYIAFQKSDYPVVGDYVIFTPSIYDDSGVIEKVCERYSKVERNDVGNISEKQLLATNIDIIFICMSLNEDFRIKKLQNLLTITYGSNAEVIILLTKKDLCEDEDLYINKVRELDKEVEIISVSSLDENDVIEIKDLLIDKTGVFIGSSGVGKSTFVNQMLGYKYFETKDIRSSDDQGRHTTSHRELIELDNGGSIIDTPGIRMIYSHIVEDVEDHFSEVSKLGEMCRFADCTHNHEPGCNVLKALENNALSQEVFDAYKRVVRLNRYNLKRDETRKKMQNKRKKG